MAVFDKNEEMRYCILNIRNERIVFDEEKIKLQVQKYNAKSYYAKLRDIFGDVMAS